MGSAAGLVVAIPALNEQRTVGDVVTAVRQVVPDARIVVVDDGSVDRTGDCARRAGADLLTMPFTVGVGGAMRAAFLYAEQTGAEALVQVDADGQHDPGQIPQLLAQLDRFSVVVGARFADNSYRVGLVRRSAMRFLAWAVSRFTRTQLTDTTSGFRASDARAISLFARHYPAEYLGDTVESLVIAARAGLPITEVPVTMQPRQHGLPSAGPLRAGLYLLRAVLAVVVLTIDRRPAPMQEKL